MDRSTVENAVIEGATRGMTITDSAFYVHAVTFRNNEIPPTVDTGAVNDGDTWTITSPRTPCGSV